MNKSQKENKKNVITIRVDDELLDRILKQSESEHREKSEFVRHTVTTYLEKIEEVKRMTNR